MGDRKALLIWNPNAGRGGARARARAVEQFCEGVRAQGVDIEHVSTRGPNDAARLAARAGVEGFSDVVVRGGDGTINEALQGLVGTGVRLTVWPAGTANILALEIEMPFDARSAADVFARGRTRAVTVGSATDERSRSRRYFVLMAGVGLDASVAERVRPRLKKRVGAGAFWFSGLEHLARWQPQPFLVEIEGQTYPATFAAIGKSPHYGSKLAVTPRASLDSSEFEVCVVASRSRVRYLYLLARAMRGGVAADHGAVRFIRATHVRAHGGDALVQADGEIIGQLPMTFEIIPEQIELVIP